MALAVGTSARFDTLDTPKLERRREPARADRRYRRPYGPSAPSKHLHRPAKDFGDRTFPVWGIRSADDLSTAVICCEEG